MLARGSFECQAYRRASGRVCDKRASRSRRNAAAQGGDRVLSRPARSTAAPALASTLSALRTDPRARRWLLVFSVRASHAFASRSRLSTVEMSVVTWPLRPNVKSRSPATAERRAGGAAPDDAATAASANEPRSGTEDWDGARGHAPAGRYPGSGCRAVTRRVTASG